MVEYEPDTDLRDTEQVPLLEEGGIEAFLRREVLPHAADAWYDPDSVKTGYEISFTRYFYKPQPLRTLEEIRADILALEKETEGLLGEIIGGVIADGCRVLHSAEGADRGPGTPTRRVRLWNRYRPCASKDRGLVDNSGDSTKWRRIYWVFLDRQRRARLRATSSSTSSVRSWTPARFVGRSDAIRQTHVGS